MVALYIDVFVKLLTKFKFSTVDGSIERCSQEGCLALSLLWLLLFNVGFVFIASCFTVYEPVAAGSGIPEIKCYLNGVKVPNIARFHTLVSKSVGVLFSVAGGLFVGKEGPMIHSGAIIGAGVPQFQSLAFKKINFKYSFFRTDRDKRDFVSSGAAAGVAAAFGAPIGGVLFSLEEGSSFWNQKLTWRTFFCSMSATFSLNFFLSGIDLNSWGLFYLPGLIDFGEFKCQGRQSDCRLWNALDLFVFVLIGLIGGLLGAIFNTLNRSLTLYRMKHVQRKHKVHRILEAMLVAMVTTTVAFVAAMTLGECRKIPTQVNGTVEDSVRTYFCKDGYYNDMATLFFNSQEVGIKQLFHQAGTFSMPTLGIFFIVFFLLSCWTYGVSVPSGLFVPSLFCGAAYGRFIANLLENYIGYDTVYSGTFALIGAAAFLGGVVRMTISLTVILIESTNEISYGLPLMLTLMVAKWAGDVFNEGLYDIHISLKGVPLLEWDISSEASRLKAKDIMDRKLVVVFPQTRVASLVKILKTTVHNAFPVVTLSEYRENDLSDSVQNTSENFDRIVSENSQSNVEMLPRFSPMQFAGLILRSHLVVLLERMACREESRGDNQNLEDGVLSYEELTRNYPRYPDVHDVDLTPLDPQTVIDVRPYMNECPYVVYPDTAVPQVFNLFRSMGLRHLPVVSHDGKLTGMITRHNLTHEFLHEALHRQQHQRQHH